MRLELKNLTKSFGGVTALDNISFSAAAPEFICLLGPSGCGKTTLLRLIAGLAMPDRGQLLLDDEDLTRIPARQRGFGIVFQAYSLFPNMNVAENIGYGLKIRGRSLAERTSRVAELLDLIRLSAPRRPLPVPALRRPATAGRSRAGGGRGPEAASA